MEECQGKHYLRKDIKRNYSTFSMSSWINHNSSKNNALCTDETKIQIEVFWLCTSMLTNGEKVRIKKKKEHLISS